MVLTGSRYDHGESLVELVQGHQRDFAVALAVLSVLRILTVLDFGATDRLQEGDQGQAVAQVPFHLKEALNVLLEPYNKLLLFCQPPKRSILSHPTLSLFMTGEREMLVWRAFGKVLFHFHFHFQRNEERRKWIIRMSTLTGSETPFSFSFADRP